MTRKPERSDYEWWLQDQPYVPTLTVVEAERKPINTGLLDQFGRKLMRDDRREPIGFVHFRDRK